MELVMKTLTLRVPCLLSLLINSSWRWPRDRSRGGCVLVLVLKLQPLPNRLGKRTKSNRRHRGGLWMNGSVYSGCVAHLTTLNHCFAITQIIASLSIIPQVSPRIHIAPGYLQQMSPCRLCFPQPACCQRLLFGRFPLKVHSNDLMFKLLLEWTQRSEYRRGS